jgi:hypothetical protein
MTARQAETILMLSDFLENCSVLFVPWLKGVAGVPSMISMSIGYGHVCDEHNGRY